MAIRLHGEEAVNQAHYTESNDGLVANSEFHIEKEGRNIHLSPQEALRLVRDGTIEPEKLTCEVRSVWDLVQENEINRSLFIHPCPNTVLILSREYGAEIGGGIRGFGVLLPSYENAVRWAMNSPVIDLDYDRDEFIVRLHPRMLLRKKAWSQDVDLLRYAKEISMALIEIFGIEPESVWEKLRQNITLYHEGQPFLHGGNILDTVLEEVSQALEETPPGKGPPKVGMNKNLDEFLKFSEAKRRKR